MCLYTRVFHTYTHILKCLRTHRRAHAQTEAQTLRNTKIVIFTFYADAALFSRMRLKNLLRSPFTVLLSMFISASATLQLLFKQYLTYDRRYTVKQITNVPNTK